MQEEYCILGNLSCDKKICCAFCNKAKCENRCNDDYKECKWLCDEEYANRNINKFLTLKTNKKEEKNEQK